MIMVSGNFELTAKYLDIGLYDAEGKPLTEAQPETAETDEEETAAETGDTETKISTTDRRLQEPDEESAGYAFRAEYMFSTDGQLAGIQVDGTELTPEEEYDLEKSVSLCTPSRPKMKNIFPASRRPRM